MGLPVLCILFCYLSYSLSPLFDYRYLAGGLFLGSLGLFLRWGSWRRYALCSYSLIIFLLYLLFGRAVHLTRFTCGLETKRITALEGVLLEDSLLTKSANQLLRIKVAWCEAADGSGASASGVCSALGSSDEILFASSTIRVVGAFHEESSLFIAEDLQIRDIPSFARWRRSVLEGMRRRLEHSVGDERARSLAFMLLLGQSDSSAFPLKELARRTGLSHLLALSGMHLSVFLGLSTALCSLFLGSYRAKRAGMVLPCLFVLIAGPKPSLIRALGLALCSLLPFGSHGRRYSYLLALSLQLLWFPYSVGSLAFLFSWVAYTMIYIAPMLPAFPWKTGTLAVLAIAPVTLLLEGSWNAGGIFLTPVAGLLINLSMISSLLVLIGGSSFARVLLWCDGLLNDLLLWGASSNLVFGWKGYAIALAFVLTLFFALIYAKRNLLKQETHELDLSLRFTQRDHRPSGGGGAGDEQEVWTKLPHLELEPEQDRRSARCAGGIEGLGSGAGDRCDHRPSS